MQCFEYSKFSHIHKESKSLNTKIEIIKLFSDLETKKKINNN